jgi:hypothetical protein
MEAFCSLRDDVRIFRLDCVAMKGFATSVKRKKKPASKQRGTLKKGRKSRSKKKPVTGSDDGTSSEKSPHMNVERTTDAGSPPNIHSNNISSNKNWLIWASVGALLFWWLF